MFIFFRVWMCRASVLINFTKNILDIDELERTTIEHDRLEAT